MRKFWRFLWNTAPGASKGHCSMHPKCDVKLLNRKLMMVNDE